MHDCPECGKPTTRKRCYSCSTKDAWRRRNAGLPPLTSTHACPGCEKQICALSLRCNGCERQRRWADPTERKKMVDGLIRSHPLTANRNCLDCDKPIKPGGKRCQSCSAVDFWKRPGHRERVSFKNKVASRTSLIVYQSRKTNPWYQKGSAHPKYKGNSAGRSSATYLHWQKDIFLRDFYRCVECNSNKDIQAHHVIHWAKCPDRRFDVTNGVTLCLECHRKKHGWAMAAPTRKQKKAHRSFIQRKSGENPCPHLGQMTLAF